MRKYFLLFAFLIASIPCIFSQNISNGVDLLKQNRVEDALTNFKLLYDKYPKNAEVNYFLGLSYYMLEKYNNALPHVKFAYDKNFVNNKFDLGLVNNSKFLMAKVCFYEYLFDESLEALDIMKSNQNAVLSKSDSISIANLRSKALLGKELILGVSDVCVVDSVVIDKSDLLKFYPQDREVGYLSHNGDAYSFLCGRKDMEVFASVDSSGDLNLNQKYKYLKGWGNPTKLSDNINSSYDENYPFVLSDGITVYFASNNDAMTLGGYDIFISSKNSENDFRKAQNIGMPFNSVYNDYLMVVDERNKLGYFASDRYMNKGKVAVYMFEYSPYKKVLKDTCMNNLIARAKNIILNKKEGKSFANVLQNTDNNLIEGADFVFVVFDDLEYTKYSDFRNFQALGKFKELQAKLVDRKMLKDKISQLRIDYNNANKDYKNRLKEIILDIEAKLIDIDYEIKNLENKVRQFENENLVER